MLNKKLVFGTWKLKLVTVVVAFLVVGGIATVFMKICHPTLCRRLIFMGSLS